MRVQELQEFCLTHGVTCRMSLKKGDDGLSLEDKVRQGMLSVVDERNSDTEPDPASHRADAGGCDLA